MSMLIWGIKNTATCLSTQETIEVSAHILELVCRSLVESSLSLRMWFIACFLLINICLGFTIGGSNYLANWTSL